MKQTLLLCTALVVFKVNSWCVKINVYKTYQVYKSWVIAKLWNICGSCMEKMDTVGKNETDGALNFLIASQSFIVVNLCCVILQRLYHTDSKLLY